MNVNPQILAVSIDFARLEAALVDSAGAIAHIETAPLPVISRSAGRVFMEPAEVLQTAAAAVRAVAQRKPREARRIAGVGLIGRSPSAALVGDDGPETPFILPADERARRAAESLDCDARQLRAISGLGPERMELPAVMAAFGDAAGKLLTPKDFLKWALTGAFTTDALDAQRTFLFDLESRGWSAELQRLFGVDRTRLAEILPAEAPAGPLSEKAARAFRLPAGLPVSCGMGDWGEYLGAGAWRPGDAFEHIGTTGAFYGVTDSRPPREAAFDVRPHASPGLYLAGREGLPGGACLEWLLEKSFLTRDGEIDWPRVEDELEAVAAMGKPENVQFFPRLAGGAGQVSHGAFVDLRMSDNLTSLIQALMEGLFFDLKAVAEALASTGWQPRAVYSTGQVGFKHAPRRTRAHIYGAPVHAGRRPGANLVSAALVGAVAAGVYPTLEAAREKMLDIDGGTAPDEHARALYEEHFARWLAAQDAMRRTWKGDSASA